jgi:hypothetical protein
VLAHLLDADALTGEDCALIICLLKQMRPHEVTVCGYTPSRAFCSPRKKPNSVTHVPGMNSHPSLGKDNLN